MYIIFIFHRASQTQSRRRCYSAREDDGLNAIAGAREKSASDGDNKTSSTGSRTSDYLSNTQRRTALRAAGKPMTDNSIASNPSRSTSIALTSQPSPRPLNGMQSRRAAPFASCRAFLLPPPGMVLAAIIALTAIMAPVSSPAQDQPPTTDKNFTLVHGDGAAVCDAYLQVLNQSHFDVTPFCGRPDNGPGFMLLKRQYWGVEQIFQLAPHVYGFMVFDNQSHLGRWFSPNPDNPNKPLVTTNPETQDSISDSLHRNWMRMWSYEEPIDIENDGSPRNVLIWQDGGAQCGSDYADHPWTVPYVPQQALIINSDGKTIDERLTRAIFGVPEESSPTRSLRRPKYIPGVAYDASPFKPLAESIGIFGYRGRYYINTENRPKTQGGPLPPVIVYLRERNRTAKVCAFRPENVPVPVD